MLVEVSKQTMFVPSSLVCLILHLIEGTKEKDCQCRGIITHERNSNVYGKHEELRSK
jgi:hypothetical protein